MNDLEFRQQHLDTKSDSFCAAKWYNATIWLGSGQTTSCHHPPAHAIDIDEIKTILNDCGHKNNAEVMLMPQATEIEDYTVKARLIADICLTTGFSFSPRLHVLLWGNKRGV